MSSSKIFLLTIIISLFIFFSLYSRSFVLRSDFVNIYTATSMVKNGQGKYIYNIAHQKAFQKKFVDLSTIKFLPFRHSPLIALLFLPFSYLSLKNAYLIFAYFNIASLFFFYLEAKKVFSNIFHNLLFVILVFLSIPSLHTIMIGQTPIMLSLVLLILYVYLKRQDWFKAGIVGGLIFFLKIQLIALLPFIYLLSTNRKKFISGFVLSSIVLLIISLQVIGFPGLLSYPGFIFKTENGLYGSNLWDSFSLASLLSWLGINRSWLLILNIFLYTLAVLFFNIKLKRRSFEQNFVILSILVPLFSVHFLAHDLTILNVTILILFNRYYQLRKNAGQVIFFVAALLYSLIFFLIIPVIFGVKLNLGAFVLLIITLILDKHKL